MVALSPTLFFLRCHDITVSAIERT